VKISAPPRAVFFPLGDGLCNSPANAITMPAHAARQVSHTTGRTGLRSKNDEMASTSEGEVERMIRSKPDADVLQASEIDQRGNVEHLQKEISEKEQKGACTITRN
jgi:hypothetical protein